MPGGNWSEGAGLLATNASAETVEFLRRYYEAIDAQRHEEALACFAPDATVRPVNGTEQPWMDGLVAMAKQLRGVAATRHSITAVVEGTDGETAYEVEITYVLKSGEEVTLAGAAFCQINEERFQYQRLYIDLAPVLEAVERGREG